MNTSEQLCWTSSKWLQENIWENVSMTNELNSELINLVTLLANKLWLYALETANSSNSPVCESFTECNVLHRVIQQKDSLHCYRNLLRDLRTIVEQI